MNNELALITILAMFGIIAVSCVLAGVRFHHWLLEHPKAESAEHEQPDMSLAVSDPVTAPLSIVMVEQGSSDAEHVTRAAPTGVMQLIPALAVTASEPVEEQTLEMGHIRDLTNAMTEIVDLRERCEKQEHLRKRYLKIVRNERRHMAEVIQIVPELRPVFMTPPVATALRRLEAEEAA